MMRMTKEIQNERKRRIGTQNVRLLNLILILIRLQKSGLGFAGNVFKQQHTKNLNKHEDNKPDKKANARVG